MGNFLSEIMESKKKEDSEKQKHNQEKNNRFRTFVPTDSDIIEALNKLDTKFAELTSSEKEVVETCKTQYNTNHSLQQKNLIPLCQIYLKYFS